MVFVSTCFGLGGKLGGFGLGIFKFCVCGFDVSFRIRKFCMVLRG